MADFGGDTSATEWRIHRVETSYQCNILKGKFPTIT